MKLGRGMPHNKAGSHAGSWFSTDYKWQFTRGTDGWNVSCLFPDLQPGLAAAILHSGLNEARFKTRRETVAALALLLDGVPKETHV